MPTQYAANTGTQSNSKACLYRRFTNSYGLCKYQVANERCVDVSGRRYACTSTEESQQPEGKRFAPCQNKSLHSGYHPQGGSEPGLNGLDNFYIPTSNLVICFFVLEDSSPSAEICFDTERSACPQAAGFPQSTYTHNASHLRLHTVH